MAKSKDTKKENTKTNRRKVTKPVMVPPAPDGFTPTEFLNQLQKTAQNRQQMHDIIKPFAIFGNDSHPRRAIGSHRLVIPFSERRRVKVGNDEEFFAGEFIKMESIEYMLVQAPTKDTCRVFWRAAVQDQIKLLMCLNTEEEMTTSDDFNKCYQYFPTEVDQPMQIEHPKGRITVVLKSKEMGSFGNVKWNLEYSEEKLVNNEMKCEPSETDNPLGPQSRNHQLTIHQFLNWPSGRPETGHPLEQTENLARFFMEFNKCEFEIMRKAMENFVAPVFIQSMDCVNRGGAAWVILMLLKDVEKRECFDVLDLIKKLQKIRPGSLSTYYSFSCTLAIALHIAISMKWCEKDCQAALNDLMAKFPDRKVNELGNLLVT